MVRAQKAVANVTVINNKIKIILNNFSSVSGKYSKFVFIYCQEFPFRTTHLHYQHLNYNNLEKLIKDRYLE